MGTPESFTLGKMSWNQSPHSQICPGGSSSASRPPCRFPPESRSNMGLFGLRPPRHPEPEQDSSLVAPPASCCSEGSSRGRNLLGFCSSLLKQEELRFEQRSECGAGRKFLTNLCTWSQRTEFGKNRRFERVWLRQIWGFWSTLNRKLVYRTFYQQSVGKRLD